MQVVYFLRLRVYRLDFVSFTIAQPTGGTCTDTFQVGGATTVAPIICGDNSGQHSKYSQMLFLHLKIKSFIVFTLQCTLMFHRQTLHPPMFSLCLILPLEPLVQVPVRGTSKLPYSPAARTISAREKLFSLVINELTGNCFQCSMKKLIFLLLNFSSS